jgi:hypothetical protein
MLINGVDILTVAKRLGHSKTSVTLDTYGHLIPGVQEKAAYIMDEITTPVTLFTRETAPGIAAVCQRMSKIPQKHPF